MNTRKKPTFYQLRLTHGVNIFQLSRTSGISSLVVWSMLVGRAVTRDEAQYVLEAFNTLSDTTYTLVDVDIALIEDEDEFNK